MTFISMAQYMGLLPDGDNAGHSRMSHQNALYRARDLSVLIAQEPLGAICGAFIRANNI
jgi:hypothetical protein